MAKAVVRPSAAAAAENGIRLYFSPRGGCTDAIVAEIAAAETSIDVQAYRLTSLPIVKALHAAHDRGVKVRIALDSAQQSDKYTDATYFANAGMHVTIDPLHAIAHSKVIVIDGETVITGSFNFSDAAEEKNAENLLIIKDHPALAAAYAANVEKHVSHCIRYVSPSEQRPE